MYLFNYEEYLDRREAAREDGRYVGVGCVSIIDPPALNTGYVSVALSPDAQEKTNLKSGTASSVAIQMQPDASLIIELDSAPSG